MQALAELRAPLDSACDQDWVEVDRLPASNGLDLARVEMSIAQHLCGQDGRCAWLRSRPFMRLRLTALYYPWLSESEPVVLYHQGLRVVLHRGTVALYRQSPTQGCFLQTLEELAASREEATREHMRSLAATRDEAMQERMRAIASQLLGKRARGRG